MFKMTRKQFKKKSSQALKDIGPSILLLMEITAKQQKKTISSAEAKIKLDIIRKEVETVFFDYEKIKPPSKYLTLHLKILQLLTKLQEVVASNQEYLILPEGAEADQQLNLSIKRLQQFREEFHLLRREVEGI